MTDKNEIPDDLENNARDRIVVITKAVLGVVPYGGSLLAELAGTAIPNQRIDRLAKFSAVLEEKLSRLEEEVIKSKWKDDKFLELSEEVIRQAARATSDDRREYLADFLSKAMTKDQAAGEDQRHILRILGELNDVEVIWLMSYAVDQMPGNENERFYDLHSNILTPAENYTDAIQEEHDKATLQLSYKMHLAELGLLDKRLRFDRNNQPELEVGRRNFKYNYSISGLGHMLLDSIDFSIEGDAYSDLEDSDSPN